MAEDRIHQIEDHVRELVSAARGANLAIAHGFQHLDRVRGWAVRIAQGEGLGELELVEAAALLHDVGLTHTEQRSQHAEVGAEMAAQFLHEGHLFADREIDAIADAIRCHSSLRGGGILGRILRDADILDAVGAVGIMRAFTSAYARPEYDPRNIRGTTWGVTARGFDVRFAQGEGIGNYIVDQVNFQISLYGNLATETAQRIARPLVDFMTAYMIQLETEVNSGRRSVHDGT